MVKAICGEETIILGTGSIVARVFTSDAEIPLFDAAVSIIGRSGRNEKTLLAFRLTDLDGLTGAFSVPTPDASESRNDVPGAQPFAVVDIMAEQAGYDRILAENVQVFPNVETRQDFQMIPTGDLPDVYDRTETFEITPQDL